MLISGIFPDTLKCAKVIPLLKKGDASIPDNYKPITILFSKIIEKLLKTRLVKYPENINYWNDYQFGFRPK